MDLQLARQVVVVTGAASGIGAAIARVLSAEGVGGLVLTDRNAPGLARLGSDLTTTTPVETIAAGRGCYVRTPRVRRSSPFPLGTTS